MRKIFEVPDGQIGTTNVIEFNCTGCGKTAANVRVTGVLYGEYKKINGVRRRMLRILGKVCCIENGVMWLADTPDKMEPLQKPVSMVEGAQFSNN